MFFLTKEPIDKGWSGDKKYRVTDSQGSTFLLRVSPAEAYERKLCQFRRMQHLATLDIPMCLPVEFGLCEDGVYSVQSWVSGHDATLLIPTLSLRHQYAYGLDAGRILQRIHTLPAPVTLRAGPAAFPAKSTASFRCTPIAP